ncbi:MAG: peptidoglycan editing factor PgeF [Oscillospiraceae bacterium]|nr:peptidoglycan editing factor PgeF [Oscillospiraceae bacterium]
MEFENVSKGGVTFLTAPNIKARHAFTTRLGGVSEGYLSSLNLGENRGDTPENVRENYRRLGEALGFDPSRMVFTRQVHGNTVRTVTASDIHRLFEPVPYEADGIVTADKSVTLVCFTADCVPVLLCDARRGVAGAVHCGWRSSVADILGNAVKAMRALGALEADICAAIGPSIGKCCFEVGPEVVEAASAYLEGDLTGLVRPNPEREGKYFLDLRGANARRLVRLGLDPANIAVSGECTVCSHDRYWSHRYTKGQRGSQGAVIQLL